MRMIGRYPRRARGSRATRRTSGGRRPGAGRRRPARRSLRCSHPGRAGESAWSSPSVTPATRRTATSGSSDRAGFGVRVHSGRRLRNSSPPGRGGPTSPGIGSLSSGSTHSRFGVACDGGGLAGRGFGNVARQAPRRQGPDVRRRARPHGLRPRIDVGVRVGDLHVGYAGRARSAERPVQDDRQHDRGDGDRGRGEDPGRQPTLAPPGRRDVRVESVGQVVGFILQPARPRRGKGPSASIRSRRESPASRSSAKAREKSPAESSGESPSSSRSRREPRAVSRRRGSAVAAGQSPVRRPRAGPAATPAPRRHRPAGPRPARRSARRSRRIDPLAAWPSFGAGWRPRPAGMSGRRSRMSGAGDRACRVSLSVMSPPGNGGMPASR